MRHRYYGKKLSRGRDERRRLFSGLLRDLFLHNGIRTTLTRAQAVHPMIDSLITKAKAGTVNAHHSVMKVLSDKKATDVVMTSAKTRFAKRTSGYARIYKMGPRRGDGAEEVLIQFVDVEVPEAPVAHKKTEEKKTAQKKDASPVKKEKRRRSQKKAKKEKS